MSITASEQSQLDNNFVYHAPKPGQPGLYQALRDAAKALAEAYVQNCPVGRERSLAITKLEEAMFWANAAIARG